jgi:aryl-alcohol dehydrogenase-like predicted oxidoreductase
VRDVSNYPVDQGMDHVVDHGIGRGTRVDDEHALVPPAIPHAPSIESDPSDLSQPTLWDWTELADLETSEPLHRTEPVFAEAVSVIDRSLRDMAEVETRPLLDPPERTYRTRALGDSALKLYPVTMGGGTFGWTAGVDAVGPILDAYVDAGGNAIETSAAYSAGRSEVLIGAWMRRRGNRDRVVLSTALAAEGGVPVQSAAEVARTVDESLERLGTDRIDVLHLDIDDRGVPLEETLTAAESLVRAGKVLHLGATGGSPERLMEARVTAGQLMLPRFVAVQVDYSLLHRSWFETDLSPVVRAQELAVLPRWVLGSGFLTGKYRGRRIEHPSIAQSRAAEAAVHRNKRGYRILSALDQVAGAHHVEPATVAIAWLLTKPFVTSPIVTASRADQVPALVGAAQLHLTRAEVVALDRASA